MPSLIHNVNHSCQPHCKLHPYIEPLPIVNLFLLLPKFPLAGMLSLRGLIDTGADYTALTKDGVDYLNFHLDGYAPEMIGLGEGSGWMGFNGYDGKMRLIYDVDLKFDRGAPIRPRFGVGYTTHRYPDFQILLGRDAMVNTKLVLNGAINCLQWWI